MKQALNLDSFFLSGIPDVSLQRDQHGLHVTSSTSRHFYLQHNRSDTQYRNQPALASFKPSANTQYLLTCEARLPPEMRMSLMIVEYLPDHDRVHAGSACALSYTPHRNAVAASVFVRIKGQGTITLESLSLATIPDNPARAAASHDNVENTDSLTLPSSTLPLLEGFEPPNGQTLQLDVDGLAQLELSFRAYAVNDTLKGVMLMHFEFRDSNGNQCIPNDDYAINPQLGNYIYLDCGTLETPQSTTVHIHIPKHAHLFIGKIIHWKPSIDAALSFPPGIAFRGSQIANSSATAIQDFLDAIGNSQKLIVLYTTAPYLGHETLELRPNRLAREYIALGHAVVFFPFGKIPAGLAEPIIDNKSFMQLERHLFHDFITSACQRAGRDNVFICSSFPDLHAFTAINRLKSFGWRTVYEIRDDMEEFNRVGYSKWYHTQLESEVAKLSDKIVTVSPRLAAKIEAFGAPARNIKIIPNAVSRQMITDAADCRTAAAMVIRNKSKTVGYIGHLTHAWFDWTLLIETARRCRDIRFELIGHGLPPTLALPQNIHYLGPKTHCEFIEISKGWKAGLIPFRRSPLTFAVDPNKIYEYLAVGLRTVTAKMGCVAQCPSTYIYHSSDQFSHQLRQALSSDITAGELGLINAYLRDADWHCRAVQTLDFIFND